MPAGIQERAVFYEVDSPHRAGAESKHRRLQELTLMMRQSDDQKGDVKTYAFSGFCTLDDTYHERYVSAVKGII